MLTFPTSDVKWSQEALIGVMFASWFDRVWVLQEFVLSRDPWIQVGKYRTRWETFHLSTQDLHMKNVRKGRIEDFSNIRRHYWNSKNGAVEEEFSYGHIIGRTLKAETHQGSELEKHSDKEFMAIESLRLYILRLLNLLSIQRGKGVSDSKDLVYAHLGLANVYEGPYFAVDYTQTVWAVFIFVAQMSLNVYDYRVLFQFVKPKRPRSTPSQLPSWVPDVGRSSLLTSLSQHSD